MSPNLVHGLRFIPALQAEQQNWEAFPYFEAHFSQSEMSDSDDDRPIAEGLSNPEDDVQRLASVDQVIAQKLQTAETQAQEITRQAYEEGFSAGEVEGRTFGESQFKIIAERLNKHMEELQEAARLLSHATEDEILALSLAMAEYLAGQEMLRSRDGILPLITRVLAEHPFSTSESDPTQKVMELHLNPKDHELLGDRLMDRDAIRLVDNPELSRGSLQLHSPEGILDATLERRRDKLLSLISRFKEESHEA